MKFILSCTTTFERKELFYYTFISLCKQSLKPDLFLINISEDAYLSDSGFDELPSWLQKTDQSFIKVNWVKNTGPYRKLIPAIDYAGDDDVIVTADDDVLYHEDWLKELIAASKQNPDSIIAGRTRKIKKNIFGNWQNYNNWSNMKSNDKSLSNLPIGCDGVLYRKKLLDLEFLLDNSYLKICPKTDDLWFKFSSLRKQTPILCAYKVSLGNIHLKHNKGLQEFNLVSNGVNNRFFNKFISLPFFRHFYKIILLVMDYLGINRSNNDKNWDLIYGYSRSNQVQQYNS